MNARQAGLAVVASFLCASTAQAQEALVESPGYKIGEGTFLHPAVGAEAGYISNVFYEEAGAVGSGILRVIADISIASTPKRRREGTRVEDGVTPTGAVESGSPPTLEFRSGVRFTFNEYLSGNDNAKEQRNVAVGAHLLATVFPEGRVSFLVRDVFRRDTRPVNAESPSNVNRLVNSLDLTMRWKPPGSTLGGYLRYTNRIDKFEGSEYAFADRMHHDFALGASWQYLPITQFNFEGQIGMYGQLGNSTLQGAVVQSDSTPLRLSIGSATAITERTTVRLQGGYSNSFHSSGASFSGVFALGEFGYRFAPLSRLLVGYQRDWRDSIQANFYSDHSVHARYEQQIRRVTMTALGRVRLRNYQGIPTQFNGSTVDRSDLILEGDVGAEWFVKDNFVFTAHYQLLTDSTDWTSTYDAGDGTTATDDPSFARHEISIGVRGAF